MDKWEIAFYSVLFVCNMSIMTQIARKGFPEVGLPNNMSFWGIGMAFVGMLTITGTGMALKRSGMEMYDNWYALVVVVGVPVAWIFLLRWTMPPGFVIYNKARARTVNWSRTHFVPGGRTPEDKAAELREFGFARSAERMFRKAAELMLRGTKKHFINRRYDLSELGMNVSGGPIINCPGCGFQLQNFGPFQDRNMSAVCGMCGSVTTMRISGGKAESHTILRKPTYVQDERSRVSAAACLVELGFLLRMMNRFDDARESLGRSMEILDQLTASDPESRYFLGMRSNALFRLGEINHVTGKHEIARQQYQESIEIDRHLSKHNDIKLTGRLLAKL